LLLLFVCFCFLFVCFSEIAVEQFRKEKNLEAVCLLLCHYRLVFKKKLLLLQCFGHICSKNEVSSLTRNMLNKPRAQAGVMLLISNYRC